MRTSFEDASRLSTADELIYRAGDPIFPEARMMIVVANDIAAGLKLAPIEFKILADELVAVIAVDIDPIE